MAVWKGWRNHTVEEAVIARAVGLAHFSGDPATADRYIDKIFDLIELLEENPRMGHTCTKAQGRYRFIISPPAPGNPDTLVYFYDETSEELIGEGVFPWVPPLYL